MIQTIIKAAIMIAAAGALLIGLLALEWWEHRKNVNNFNCVPTYDENRPSMRDWKDWILMGVFGAICLLGMLGILLWR